MLKAVCPCCFKDEGQRLGGVKENEQEAPLLGEDEAEENPVASDVSNANTAQRAKSAAAAEARYNPNM